VQMWLTDIEIFALIIAALIHDYEHTGTTNAFHVNTRSVCCCCRSLPSSCRL